MIACLLSAWLGFILGFGVCALVSINPRDFE
jgi:hypothetical protein